MMTIPSIDMVTTISDAAGACAVQPPVAQAVVSDIGTLPRRALPASFPAFGGLAELVSDNAALGEALQTLVDALDIPRQADAEAKPVAVDATLVAAANMKPIADATIKTEAEVIPTVAEKPVAVDASLIVEKPSVIIETPEAVGKPTVAVEIPDAVAKSVVAKDAPVVAADAPVVATSTVDAVPSPRQTVEVPSFERREGGFVPTSVAAQPRVAVDVPVIAEKPVVELKPEPVAVRKPVEKSVGIGDMPEAVVLQAAPVVPQPGGDVSGNVLKPTDRVPVAAVSRAAPIDVSSMFLAAAEEVAAAVTVSPALMRGEAGEIRVQLRPDVLEGAEVIVAVDGKKMDVVFVPTVTHVADTVAANRPLVQQQLAERIPGFEISVAVAQTVATNVSVGVASSASAQAAVVRARRTNGRA